LQRLDSDHDTLWMLRELVGHASDFPGTDTIVTAVKQLQQQLTALQQQAQAQQGAATTVQPELCRTCDGLGYISQRLPVSTSAIETCPVCKGAKIFSPMLYIPPDGGKPEIIAAQQPEAQQGAERFEAGERVLAYIPVHGGPNRWAECDLELYSPGPYGGAQVAFDPGYGAAVVHYHSLSLDRIAKLPPAPATQNAALTGEEQA
jgi:predicted Zn-ribbon and HTH transcriptional regulator